MDYQNHTTTKNDDRDAAAIVEAATGPAMRFVALK